MKISYLKFIDKNISENNSIYLYYIRNCDITYILHRVIIKLFSFKLTSKITFRCIEIISVYLLFMSTLCRSQDNDKQCSNERNADFNVTLDLKLFQFSSNAVEARNIFTNIFHYYLGHLASSPSWNSLLSSISLRVYASIPWLSARYPRTVSSFPSRNIRVVISYKLSSIAWRCDRKEILSHY